MFMKPFLVMHACVRTVIEQAGCLLQFVDVRYSVDTSTRGHC